MPLVLGLVLVLATQLVGCQKDPPPPPVIPEEIEPTFEFFVKPAGVLPYGNGADFYWTADKNTNKVVVKVRGVIKDTRYGSNSRQGALHIGCLTKNVLVSVTATNVKLSVTKDTTIQVGDWTTSTFGLVSYYPWRYKAQTISSLDGKLLATVGLTEKEKSWVFYYHKDGRLTFSPNLSNNTEPWYLQNDTTMIRNGVARRLQVNQEEMTISYQTTWNSQQVWFNMVFEHASDTPTDPE